MKKIMYDNPYIVYGTPDTIETINQFCANGMIGRVYSRFYEMNQSQRQNKHLESLMDSLGFTGISNSFSNPPTYAVTQWFGYDQDENNVEELLSEIGSFQ